MYSKRKRKVVKADWTFTFRFGEEELKTRLLEMIRSTGLTLSCAVNVALHEALIDSRIGGVSWLKTTGSPTDFDVFKRVIKLSDTLSAIEPDDDDALVYKVPAAALFQTLGKIDSYILKAAKSNGLFLLALPAVEPEELVGYDDQQQKLLSALSGKSGYLSSEVRPKVKEPKFRDKKIKMKLSRMLRGQVIEQVGCELDCTSPPSGTTKSKITNFVRDKLESWAKGATAPPQVELSFCHPLNRKPYVAFVDELNKVREGLYALETACYLKSIGPFSDKHNLDSLLRDALDILSKRVAQLNSLPGLAFLDEKELSWLGRVAWSSFSSSDELGKSLIAHTKNTSPQKNDC